MAEPKTLKIKFIRDTTPREDTVAHAKGEVIEVSKASVQRWVRRGAAEEVATKTTESKGK